MEKSPVLVEVNVERKGIFVVTTSILMCNDYLSAVGVFNQQSEMADALMDEQSKVASPEFGYWLWSQMVKNGNR